MATIIDDAGAGFTTVGSWTTAAQGYLNLVHYQPAGSGANTATWTFTGLTIGARYRVSVTWFPFTNRATNTPYVVKDGASTVGTLSVNQQNAPVGFTDASTLWQDLGGPYTLANTTLSVVMTDNANGFVIADAVRVELISICTATGKASTLTIGTPVATTYTPATVPLRIASLKSAFHWTTKPPVGSHVDRAHPLAKGLVFYTLLNEGGGSKILESASRQFVPVTANPWSLGPYGLQMSQNGTGNEVAKLASNPITGYPCTLFFSGAALAGNNSTVRSAFGIFDNTVTNAIFLGWASTNGTLYVQVGAAAGPFWSAPIGILTQVVLSMASATDRKYYVNGLLVLTQVASVAFPTGMTNVGLGAFNSASPAFQTINYAGVYNRALTAGEAASLYTDPFQLVLPPNNRRFFTVTGPTGGGGTVTCTATGKASTLTIGTPTALLKKLGVASGIASTLTIGTPSAVLKRAGTATGLASTLTIGTPVATYKKLGVATGRASTLTIGVPIASTFGAITCVATGRASTLIVGVPIATVKRLVTATGRASTLTIGVPVASLVSGTITCTVTGLASTLTIGHPVASVAAVSTALVVGNIKRYFDWWMTKPPLGSTIDFSHPMANGLAFYSLLNEGTTTLAANKFSSLDLVTNKSGIYNRGSFALSTPGIVAQQDFTGGTAATFSTWASNFGIVAYPFTIFMYASQITNTNAFTPIFGIYNGAGNSFYKIVFNGGNYVSPNQGGSFINTYPMVLGQYYLLTIVYDAPNSWRMYMDSVLKATISSTTYAMQTLTQVFLGAFGAANNSHWNAAYCGIYNRALSIGEINSLIADPYQFIAPPSVRRYAIKAPPPLAVSVPKRTYHWANKPPLGSDIDLSHPLAQGLGYYVPFNEAGGTKHLDLITRRFATIGGAPLWSLGQYGPMLYMNNVGSAQGPSILNSSPIQGYPCTFFCQTMILPGNNGTARFIVGVFVNNLSGFFGIAVTGTGGTVGWDVGGGSLAAPTVTLGTNTWAHLVLVLDSPTSRKLYVNGRLNGTSTLVSTLQPGVYDRAATGGFNSGSSSFMAVAYSGIYNRSLTDGEVASLYQEPYQFVAPPSNRRFIPFSPSVPAVITRKVPRHLFAQGAL